MKNKIFTISIIFILLSLIFINNNVFAANTSSLNAWIEENKEDLSNLLSGYDYIICNNFYSNYCAVYYTTAPNTKFYFTSDGGVTGSRQVLLSTSDLGNNYYTSFLLNPNNDNNFSLPDNLSYNNQITSGDQRIVNNFSASNILYCSADIYKDGTTNVFMEKKALPPVPAKTLAGVLEEAKPVEVWKVLMKNVVASLIVCLVGFLSFRKAWAFLKSQMKAS